MKQLWERLSPGRAIQRWTPSPSGRIPAWVLWLNTFKHLLRQFQNDEIPHRAGAVAFHLTLSVFPAMLFLFSLIPYFPIPNLEDLILTRLGDVLPHGIYKDSIATIHDIVSQPQNSILSLGFFLTLFSSTAGMLELMRTFNRCLEQKESRSFIMQRVVAMGLTLLLAFALLFSMVVLVVGELVLDWLATTDLIPEKALFALLSLSQYGSSVLVLYACISILYFFAPHAKKRLAFFTWGGMIATGAIVLFSYLFSIYISQFATFNRLYGSIGTFMGFMLWLYLLSVIILVGFEFNVCREDAREELEAKWVK